MCIFSPAGGQAGGGACQERLLLWAVDGLAGVVLSGRPGSAGGGGGGLRTPRAVLWGQHAGQLAWPPHAVRAAGACTPCGVQQMPAVSAA